jgi:aquaporin Z
MKNALENHWREYAAEGCGLGIFMVAACGFAVLLFNPNSSLIFLSATFRNALMGAAMGATAIAIIFSPLGKCSGAHINPAVTLTFFRLGKIKFGDALFYVVAQFIGGSLGVLFSWLIFGNLLENAAVNFVVTAPGEGGIGAAFAAEFVISFLLMTMILTTTNSEKFSRFTPFFAGFLVAVFITFEARISGMSMNPARSFASAVVADNWNSIWIYFTAPPLAMLAAAEIYRRIGKVYCAKLHHRNSKPCIFICGYAEAVLPEEISTQRRGDF